MSTIDYYDKNAKEYFDITVNANMNKQRNTFLNYMKGNKILDFGCGSGRDAKYFKDLGYDVDAIDASKKLSLIATKYCGVNVENISFEDFNKVNYYNGIWACASILHVQRKDMIRILIKIRDSLKEDGVSYISMKDGLAEEIDRNGRYYNYVTYDSFKDSVNQINMEIIHYDKTSSINNTFERTDWNNFIIRKRIY